LGKGAFLHARYVCCQLAVWIATAVHVNPFTTNAKKCSDWAEIFSVGSFIYLKISYFMHFFIISNCKKVINDIVVFIVEIFYSALFKKMFQNSV
jgi:hypothetical protein